MCKHDEQEEYDMSLQENPELDNSALAEICQCSIKEVEAVRNAFEI